MDQTIELGSVTLQQHPTDEPGTVTIEHTGPGGKVSLIIDTKRLERWCVRLLREEQFGVSPRGAL